MKNYKQFNLDLEKKIRITLFEDRLISQTCQNLWQNILVIFFLRNITESKVLNPNKILSQPNLIWKIKAIRQKPLLYIKVTDIIYEIQETAKLRHLFELYGLTDVQRKEMVNMLDCHPIMSNHSYQMTNLTKLCIDQVNLLYKLNKYLLNQSKNRQFNIDQQNITKESNKIKICCILKEYQIVLSQNN